MWQGGELNALLTVSTLRSMFTTNRAGAPFSVRKHAVRSAARRGAPTHTLPHRPRPRQPSSSRVLLLRRCKSMKDGAGRPVFDAKARPDLLLPLSDFKIIIRTAAPGEPTELCESEKRLIASGYEIVPFGVHTAPESLEVEIRSRPPVLLVHGDSDEMLPAVLTQRAAQALEANGVQVGVHIAPGVGHGIDQTGLSHAARFLLNAFGLAVPA